ncbi:MAG TPA: hypothetical protein DIU15_19895 [Deltaproteobacteria bacterium]|nr:hypothetical protein [Deltaproteobacteria bacterium]HCP48312.1 hypothetical protein [Deltaproteobacteria bacterium]
MSNSRDIRALRELISRRFPEAVARSLPEHGVLPSGIAELDSLLPEGLPRGALTLVTGGPSSGKTGLALAFAASMTREGGSLAWVHGGAFSAPSADHSGVDLSRLLHIQAESRDEALRCADFALRWQAFHLVVLDWHWGGGSGAAWNRLHRLVTGGVSALLVLTPPLRAGSPLLYCASVHLRASRQGLGDSSLGEIELELMKSRFQAAGVSATLRYGEVAGAPFALLPDLPGLGQAWNEDREK